MNYFPMTRAGITFAPTNGDQTRPERMSYDPFDPRVYRIERGLYRGALGRTLVRIGNPTEDAGEHVTVEVVEGNYIGRNFRTPVANMNAEGQAAAAAAPHILDQLGRQRPEATTR